MAERNAMTLVDDIRGALSRKACIVGVGNPLLGDAGAGVVLVEALRCGGAGRVCRCVAIWAAATERRADRVVRLAPQRERGLEALPQPGKAAPQKTPMGEVERLGDAARKSARATGLVSPRREVQV